MITPDTGFGELIRQVLVEEGAYEVSLVFDGISALSVAQQYEFALVILDCAADDVPFAELVGALRDWHPEMRLLLIPPDNNPDDPAIDHTNPDALLPKPFYLPDLLESISTILSGGGIEESDGLLNLITDTQDIAGVEAIKEEDEAGSPLPWLEDVTTAAQYLARLSLETAARAALITRDERLWAYAGEMGQPAADQLAETVGQHWRSQSANDLARFVTLDGEEYMLYATGLEEDLVLALIFDARTPFSKIRSQSSRIARALASDPEMAEAPQGAAESTTQNETKVEAAVPETGPEMDLQRDESGSAAQALPLEWLPEKLSEDRSLLDEVEETLEPFSIPADWRPREGSAAGPRAYLEELLGEPIPSVSFPYEINRKAAQESPAIPAGEERPYFPPPETMAETRPTRVPPEDRIPQLEPESASYFNITYVCVLIPRMPDHHLIQELARHLEKWMFQICVSFDWRLEQLAIRPDYMQWKVRVHSATAPRFLMQIITRITSQRIFENFASLSESNPSGEFWAPGWMVVTSENPPTPQMVQDFIANTRRRQGL